MDKDDPTSPVLPVLHHGLSIDGDAVTTWPIPNIKAPRDRRYRRLIAGLQTNRLAAGPGYIHDAHLREIHEPPSPDDNLLLDDRNLSSIAFIIRHIIEVDETDPFILFLSEFSERQDAGIGKLRRGDKDKIDNLLAASEKVRRSISTVDYEISKLYADIDKALKTLDTKSSKLAEAKGFSERTHNLLNSLLEYSDYAKLILNIKNLIGAKSYLLAMTHINRARSISPRIRLPEAIAADIGNSLNVLRERARKESIASMKSFVEG